MRQTIAHKSKSSTVGVLSRLSQGDAPSPSFLNRSASVPEAGNDINPIRNRNCTTPGKECQGKFL